MTIGDRVRATAKFVRLIVRTIVYGIATNHKARRLPKDERPAFRAHRQMVGCALLCDIIGVRADLRGRVDEGDQMIVCNHFGILDPLVLASRMPVAFVAKAEIERWPFVGWVTRTMGVIFVHRDRVHRTTDFVEQVRERLDDGVNVLVFPEGMTSDSSEIRPFKTGAFAAIAHRQVSLLPAYLTVRTVDGRPLDDAGRDKVIWAQSPRSFVEQFYLLLSLKEATFTIDIGEPLIDIDADRKTLAREMHRRVARLADSHAHEG